MKKFGMIALTLVLTLSMVIAMAAPAAACIRGLSPGYWKNHFPPELSGATIRTIFGTGSTSITLLQALQTGGGGESAFLRQAVAQWLTEHSYGSGLYMVRLVQAAYGGLAKTSILPSWEYWVSSYPDDIDLGLQTHSMEWWKDYLEQWNSN